jgi:uncharacterized integral membrane protein
MGGLRRVATWVFRALLLLLLSVLALMNADLVQLRFFGQQWQAPLPLVVLASVIFGILIALIASLERFAALRGQIAALRHEVSVHEAERHRVPRVASVTDFDPDAVRPMER